MIKKPGSRDELIKMLEEQSKLKQQLREKIVARDIQEGQFTELLTKQYDPITKALAEQTTQIGKQTAAQTTQLRTILNDETARLLADSATSRAQQVGALGEVKAAVQAAVRQLAASNATQTDIKKAVNAIVKMFEDNPLATTNDIAMLIKGMPSAVKVDPQELADAITKAMPPPGARTMAGVIADLGINWDPVNAQKPKYHVIEGTPGNYLFNDQVFTFNPLDRTIAIGKDPAFRANDDDLKLFFTKTLTEAEVEQMDKNSIARYLTYVGTNNSDKVKNVKAGLRAIEARESVKPDPNVSSSATPSVPDPAAKVPITGSGLKEDVQQFTERYLPVGKWKMDLDSATQGLLKLVNSAGRQVLSAKPDPTFWKLLMERYNPKFAYTQKAHELFQRVVKGSGVQLSKNSMKSKLIHPEQAGGCGGSVIAYSNPNQLIERLQVLAGSSAAGNHKNPHILNEATMILDQLKGLGVITDAQYKKIWKQFGGL